MLVVDAAAAGRSGGCGGAGFRAYDDRVRLAGVILNKVGSDRHETEVRAGVEPTGVPVLGVLRRDTRLAVPSRHLGLVPADEQRDQASRAVDAAAELVRAGVDLAAVVALAKAAAAAAHATRGSRRPTATGPPGRPVVAMAGGPAFSFGTPRPPSCWPRRAPRS